MALIHDDRRCPSAHGCFCECEGCINHCGPQDRQAAWFCVTQGIVPVDNAVRSARELIDIGKRLGIGLNEIKRMMDESIVSQYYWTEDDNQT